MVQMRPDFYPKETVKGEKQVFKALSELEGADSWIALHSLDIFGDIPGGQGEADMVLLIPGKGVLVIEVKTHSEVSCTDGVWRLNGKSVDRAPHKQASNAMHAIRSYLKKTGADLYKMPFGFCVWFTGASKIECPSSNEFKPWMFLYADNLNGDVKRSLTNIMDMWANHRGLPKGGEAAGVATYDAVKEVAGMLRPNVQIRKSAAQRVAELESSLAAALENQLEIMHFISGKKQVSVISGIAGTGKTHIAIAEARKAHQRGERTLLICFNSLLARYLETELAEYSYVEVRTISKYMLDIAEIAADQGHHAEWWRETLPALAQDKMLGQAGYDRFDTLIVDESQDICLDPFLDVLELSLVGGFTKSPVMFFGDFTHQGVYMSGALALSNLMSRAPGAFECNALTINCRNTKLIGDTIMQLMNEPNAYSSYRRAEKGAHPKLISLKPGESALKHVKNEVERLAKDYSLDHIVVLSSNKEKLRNLMHESGFPVAEISLQTKGKLRWGTSQAFKGMEAPAVIFVEFEDGFAASRETFYVASTRAVAELTCIIPQPIIKILTERPTND